VIDFYRKEYKSVFIGLQLQEVTPTKPFVDEITTYKQSD
jgi:hypothetical protein